MTRQTRNSGYLPEIYDGDERNDCYEWANTFDKYAKLHRWDNNEEKLLLYFELSLSGRALAWNSTRPKNETYKTRREAFIKHFSPNPLILYHQFNTCAQQNNESCKEFAVRFLTLANRVQTSLNSQELTVQFILKLLPHIRAEIIRNQLQPFSNIDDVLKKCTTIEVAETLQQYYNHNNSPHQNIIINQHNEHTLTAEALVAGIHTDKAVVDERAELCMISLNYFKVFPKDIKSRAMYERSQKLITVNNKSTEILGYITLDVQIGSAPIRGNTCELMNIHSPL